MGLPVNGDDDSHCSGTKDHQKTQEADSIYCADHRVYVVYVSWMETDWNFAALINWCSVEQVEEIEVQVWAWMKQKLLGIKWTGWSI